MSQLTLDSEITAVPLIKNFFFYLLLIRNKDFLGLFDHGLWLQVFLCKFVLPGVEKLPTWHTGKDQVGRVRIEVHINLHTVGVNGTWSLPLLFQG